MERLRNIRIVAAVIEVDGEVMLVRQQGPTDLEPTWALPGGRVEPGEALLEALARELVEETGLTLDATSPVLLYVCETLDASDAMHSVAFVFRVRVLPDTAPIHDPDGYIQEARFVPLSKAVAFLGQNPYPPMCEAAVSWFQGGKITFWSYRVSPLGVVQRMLPS